MRKRWFVAVLLVLTLLAMSGCGTSEPPEEITLKVFIPDGITALGAAKMIKENPELASHVTVEYEITKTPDILASKIMGEEADIAVVPSTLAAVAYNRDLPYALAGTMGWGSFYLVTTEDIDGWEDLAGKEIYLIGRGQTPDAVFQYLLDANGLDPEEDVTLTYLNAATELAPAFIAKTSTVAVMPEPMLTTVLNNVADAKIVLDLNEEWKTASENDFGYPQSSLVVKTSLMEEHSAVIDEFIRLFAESIEWAKENTDELVSYAQELEIGVPAAAVSESMTRANQDFVKANDSLAEYQGFFAAMFSFDPNVIGGSLPDEEFFIQ